MRTHRPDHGPQQAGAGPRGAPAPGAAPPDGRYRGSLGSPESLLWLFTRLSAVVITVLAIIAFAAALARGARTEMTLDALLRWTFMPVPDHVLASSVDVEAGWTGPWWRAAALAMLFFASAHGFNGIRSVAEDYLERSWKRLVLRGLLLLVWWAVLGAGAYVVLTG